MSFEKQDKLKAGLIRKLLFILKIILGCKSEHDKKNYATNYVRFHFFLRMAKDNFY